MRVSMLVMLLRGLEKSDALCALCWYLRKVCWAGAFAALCLVVPRHCLGIVYRDDQTAAQSATLAAQPQFNGCGQVGVASAINGTYYGPNGSGTAISSTWILTAKHLFRNDSSPPPASLVAAFDLNGVEYTGTPYWDTGSDLALIHLTGISGSTAPFTGLPSNINPILPNIPAYNISPLDKVVWTAGYGGVVNYSNQNNPSDIAYNTGVHAGTNVTINFNSQYQGANGPAGGFISTDNLNTASDATAFEASTAEGDSGGPLFMQYNGTWYVTGTTYGPGDTTSTQTDNFIATTIASVTGQTYAPTPATPSFNLSWNPLVGVGTNSGGTATWDLTQTNFTDGKLQYQWDNSLAEDVTFGSSTLPAGVVTIVPTYLHAEDNGGTPEISATGVTVHNITFNKPSDSGVYNISAGTLPSGSAGGSALATLTFTTSSNSPGTPTIDTNWNAVISAPIVLAAAQYLNKTGPGLLALSGANAGLAGILDIQAGTVDASNTAALGSGGFSDADSTHVESGATLQMDGYSSDEHIHLNGAGAGGNGALYLSNGNTTLVDPLSLDTASTINIAPNSSLTISGSNGSDPGAQIYGGSGNGNALTLIGSGTLNLNGPATVSSVTLNGSTLNEQASRLINQASTLTISGGRYSLAANAQTFSAVTLNSGSFALNLNNHLVSGSAGGNGLITTGALTLGSSMTLICSTGTAFAVGTYALIDYTGQLTDNSNHFANWSFSGLAPGETAYFAIGNSTGEPALELVVTAVPEPSGIACLMIAVAWSGARHRRHRR